MGKSSKDKRDAYYRLAKEQGWRARSAFKLLQLDEEFDLFAGVTRVVDLCAAPGSWSQVLSRVLIKGERFGRARWLERREGLERAAGGVDGVEEGDGRGDEGGDAEEEGESVKRRREDVKIVAIDLQPMSPLEGIVMLRADITHPSTVTRLLEALDAPVRTPASTKAAQPPNEAAPPPANQLPSSSDQIPSSTSSTTLPSTHHVDLLLTDGAPDVTGLHDLDIYIQSSLLRSALALAMRVLRPGGTFVAKIFRGRDCDLLYAQLRCVFHDVRVAKPRASRASSLEAFVVARGFVVPSAEVLRELGIEEVGEQPLSAEEKEAAAQEGEALPKRERTKPYRRTLESGIVELELGSEDEEGESEGIGGPRPRGDRWIAPFLRCGDLSHFDFDADATYHLPADHKVLDPVQPPTAPPYKKALEERRRIGGFYGKTKNV